MRRLYCSLAVLAALLVVPIASAATITVNTTDDELNADGDCSLREAVQAGNTNAAVDGCTAGAAGEDTIVFADALDDGTIMVMTSSLMVRESLVIDGDDGDITLSGGDMERVLFVRAGTLTVRSLTIRDGFAPRGSGVFVANDAMLVVSDVTFMDNEASAPGATDGGAAIYLNGGAMATITDSEFMGNIASGASGSGGAIFNNGGTLDIEDSSFSGNESNRAGGAIEAASVSTTTITDTDFVENVAGANPGNGGAFHISGAGNATITGGEVTDNRAGSEGGGFWNGAGTMTVTDTEFTSNEGQGADADMGGGAVYNNGGTLVLMNITAMGNSAIGESGSGGALFTNGGTMTVMGGTISGNVANRAGAGIENAGGVVTLTGVTVDDNDISEASANPGNGGGLHSGGGTVTINGGVFSDNDATEGGGIWANGTLIIQADDAGTSDDSDDVAAEITGNTGTGDDATNGGGGVYVETGGAATITGALISDNAATGTAGSGGGLFVAADASADVVGGTISNNLANRAGAGIENAGGTMTLRGVTVDNNDIPALTAAPGNGGGLHSGGGTVTVLGGVFSNNDATEGGGLWSNGTLTISVDSLAANLDADGAAQITGNTGRGNDASNGGGGVYIETGGVADLLAAMITGNAATGTSGSGGGLFVADSSSVTVTLGSISDNEANRAGAGIEVADNPETGDDGDDATDEGPDTVLSLDRVTVADNAITVPNPGNGGGLHIGGAGSVSVLQSTVSGNTATEGAGIWAAGGSTLAVDLSTVSGNAATVDGGGIYDNGGTASADISLSSVTVAFNSAGTNGGGLFSQSGDGSTFTFQNTAVARNTATLGPDCFGMFESEDYNLVQFTVGCQIDGDTDNNVIGRNPMLGPLADNGGPTLTHLPMAGSPLTDAGQSAFDIDQRGEAREDEGDDIGSVEDDSMSIDGETGPETGFELFAARPNPIRSAATMAFTIDEAAPVRVELFNVLGQRVQTVFDGMAVAGVEQTVRLDASALAAGVYVVRLVSGDRQATQRVTIVR